MSRKWLRAHAPTVAALALALGSIGGTGVAVAADTTAAATPQTSSTSSVATTQSATATSNDSGQQVMSPLIWWPPT